MQFHWLDGLKMLRSFGHSARITSTAMPLLNGQLLYITHDEEGWN